LKVSEHLGGESGAHGGLDFYEKEDLRGFEDKSILGRGWSGSWYLIRVHT